MAGIGRICIYLFYCTFDSNLIRLWSKHFVHGSPNCDLDTDNTMLVVIQTVQCAQNVHICSKYNLLELFNKMQIQTTHSKMFDQTSEERNKKNGFTAFCVYRGCLFILC